MLSDSDDAGDDITQLTINEHYAKAFEYRKEREELEQLKAKYGSDAESSEHESTDSESAESEDEDGEELTPTVDAAILRTLARIRRKDPEIYTSGKDIFGEEKEKVSSSTTGAVKKSKEKDKSKPVYMRQAALDAVLNPSRSPSVEPLPHVEQQRALRKETIAAFHTAMNGDEDEDGLLVPRERTKDEQELEEEEYRAFIEREVGDLRDIVSLDENVSGGDDDEGDEEVKKKSKKAKKKEKKDKEKEITEPKSKASSSKAEKDQEFLMNYILNRGWIDHSARHVPTYGEITGTAPSTSKTSKSKNKSKDKGKEKADTSSTSEVDDDDEGLLSDASFDSLASHFESSYNHRFEEPNAAQIPSFPRALPSLVRRVDTVRKDARERRKVRKEEEVARRKEDVRRMKALKMREVRRRLEAVGREGGLDLDLGEALETGGGEALDLDLEGEWDPEKHDKQMIRLFGGDGDDGDLVDGDEGWDEQMQIGEDGKPVWNDDIDIGDIPMPDDDAMAMNFGMGDSKMEETDSKAERKKQKKDKKKKKKKQQDDDGVDIDAMDADLKLLDDDEEWDGTEEMRKRKLDEYMDEVYALDFNDIVGDLPTRFNYVPVQPQAYALTPVEILLATDQELNEYMSVKKYAPYKEERARWDGKRVDRLKELKSKLVERAGTWGGAVLGDKEGGANAGEEVKKRRKGKKERMKLKAEAGGGEAQPVVDLSEGKKEKRKRDVDDVEPDLVSQMSEEKAVDGETKKKKRKRTHKKTIGDGTEV